jgi:hypothetical protein
MRFGNIRHPESSIQDHEMLPMTSTITGYFQEKFLFDIGIIDHTA